MRYLILLLVFTLFGLLFFPLVKAYPFFVGTPFWSWFAMDWQPSAGVYGFGLSLAGSVYLVLLSLPMALVLGWLACLQLANCTRKWFRSLSVALLETWISLPSVVIGVWAVSELVPLVRDIYGSGYCVLSAALGLTLFVVPTCALLFYRAYQQYLEQFSGLEQSFDFNAWEKTEMFLRTQGATVIGIVNYTFCRLFGETMVVLMLSGNSVQIPGSPFAGVRTLTATISLEMAYATGRHEMALFALGVIAILAVLLVLLPQYRSMVND